MKVTVTNATQSSKVTAELHIESGVLIYGEGEVSHVLFEKHFNKKIELYKEPEVVIVEAAPERSAEPQVKKSKAKSKQ